MATSPVVQPLRSDPHQGEAVREAAPGTSPGPVIILSRHAGPGNAFLLVSCDRRARGRNR
jgi:hypothetical protein